MNGLISLMSAEELMGFLISSIGEALSVLKRMETYSFCIMFIILFFNFGSMLFLANCLREVSILFLMIMEEAISV